MDLRKNLLRSVLVARIDSCSQTILGVVHEPEGFLVVRNFLNADDWAKSFLLHQLHGVVDLSENGGLKVKARSIHFFPTT